MSVGKYLERLKEIENAFYAYKQDLDKIIDEVSSSIDHTVITKGKIVNQTPYYNERIGDKVSGKTLQAPIISDDCMKYHYDSENRLIMVEEYSVHFGRFRVTEIFFYNELTERLWLSSEILMVLSVFDNAFSNTQLCLTFAGRNGYKVEEFIYERDVLTEIKIRRKNSALDNYTETHRFLYENQKLIQIERVFQNGCKELIYTTKKPNFNKMKEAIYKNLKNLITDYEGEFASFGIEGFIDQQQPMFCVCFTEESSPSDLIADWNVQMHNVWVYDWQMNETQEKKCAKIIAEIIVELVEEGLLKGKQIFFHQEQVCAAQLYSGVRSVFKKAGISVK